jgi:ketosteroid isomerase-like protein
MDAARSLECLVDKDLIRDVIHAYCLHFDRAEVEEVLALFTPDAVVDYGPDVPTMTGRDALAAMVRRGLEEFFAATSHHVSNVMIDFDGPDAARSLSYLYAWHSYRDGRPESELWGQYRHEFRRMPDGWRISRLVLSAAGARNFHRDRMHPIGRRAPEAS